MIPKRLFFILKITLTFFFSCNMNNEVELLKKSNFRKIIDEKETDLFRLVNNVGTTIELTNYGARVVSIWTRDKKGNFDDIVLGCSSIDEYIEIKERYFGATIGRYGNRIENAAFNIDGVEYNLYKNNGNNNLHGGKTGFNDVIWDTNQINSKKIEFKYFSKHLEEGFPGNMDIKVSYSLSEDNELKIEYFAETDMKTHVNLTHHSFFNLQGVSNNNSINNHLLYINADNYTPVRADMIPNGDIQDVKGSPFDFRKPTKIGQRIDSENKQLKFGNGYDHNFILNSKSVDELSAKLVDPVSGRFMEVFTNEPGLQFYSGNFLNEKTMGKKKVYYGKRSALCLETQHFPNSPNQKNFPNTILEPNDKYYSICIYKFGVVN